MRIWYESFEALRSDRPLELGDVMEYIKRILWDGGVSETIPVDDEGRVVGNYEIYEALRRLGVERAPVSRGEPVKIYVPLEALGFYDEVQGSALKVFDSTIELLYRNWPTPLFKLRSLSRKGYRVWAKWEAYNPFSWSVKDRIGWYMFVDAMRRGKLSKILYEATSTNTGMALAAMAAAYGVKAKLYLPSAIQKASDVLLRVMGADVVRMPKPLTVDFIDDVDREAKNVGATHLNQFENDRNFEVHLRYTAKELDLQLRSAGIIPNAIIGGIGTSGHMSAISLYFKSRYRGAVKIYGAQPAPGDTIPGIRRVETGMKWIHMVEFDGIIDVPRDEAIEAAVRIARSEGILIGLSSGAVTRAFEKLVEEGALEEGDYILVYPDNGLKYVEQFTEYLKKKGEL